MTSLWLRGQRFLARRWLKRPLPLTQPRGVVSFSFDDALQSACRGGRELHDHANVKGTWYVAGGLSDQFEQGRPCHSLEDLRTLHEQGHQLACHTWSHHRCAGSPASELTREWARNATFLETLGLNPEKLHFSFPFGDYDWSSKYLAGQHFVSCRTTEGSVQVGVADLNGLSGVPLYDRRQNTASLETLFATTAEHRGWLILYTHEVEEQPGPWGCSPKTLSLALRLARESGCLILPVDAAIDHFRTPLA